LEDKYHTIMGEQMVDSGGTLIESADKAVEFFMQLEDQYMEVSASIPWPIFCQNIVIF